MEGGEVNTLGPLSAWDLIVYECVQFIREYFSSFTVSVLSIISLLYIIVTCVGGSEGFCVYHNIQYSLHDAALGFALCCISNTTSPLMLQIPQGTPKQPTLSNTYSLCPIMALFIMT